MKWYNYKAQTLNTPLDTKSVILPSDLHDFITGMGDKSLYHCYYELEERSSYVNYNGMLRPAFGMLHVDLDSEEDHGEAAWRDACALRDKLVSLGIDAKVYFSGNKGFHVAFSGSAAGITEGAKAEVEAHVKSLLVGLQHLYPTVDLRIWNANRKFRAYRSRHEKSGLYKIEVTDFTLTLAQVRELAKVQPVSLYAFTTKCAPNPWLLALISSHLGAASPTASSVKHTKEIAKGQTIDDDSMRFRNFADKKCIKAMREQWYPQFNRHDIGLRLMTDAFDTGVPLARAKELLAAWATSVFEDATRAQDTVRQVTDTYSKPQDYRFGCYDDVKKAYCSAKCKLYDQLDRTRRARPMDTTKSQSKDNATASQTPDEKPSEGQLADIIISQMPRLCKSNGQYFQWNTTHWKRIDGGMFEDSLVKVAMSIYGNQATIKKNKALAEHVIAKIPIAPESNHFFSSCPNKFNFTDCTAEMLQSDGVLKLVTHPHNPDDYLAYCAPFPLEAPHGLPKGTEFTKYLATRAEDVGEEGIRIIKQMLGAALVPYVPRIFFIEGITNAGKSTLAKLLIRLLGEENVSEVLPVLRGGGADRFNWEPSIGKLANIVLELPKGAELDVNTLKMVRDKSPVSIDRKSQKHVKATLPFLHVYCCNQMPHSFEGNTGALDNRVSMLFFKPGYLNGSSGIVEFADAIWMDDAGSVLEAAREGLADLMASGFKYFNGTASAKMTKDWQKMTDSIQLYFDEINSGEWCMAAWEGTQWEKGSSVFENFKSWCSESGRRPMGKQHFYKELETRLGVPRKVNAKGGERFDFDNVVQKVVLKPTNHRSDTNPNYGSTQEY